MRFPQRRHSIVLLLTIIVAMSLYDLAPASATAPATTGVTDRVSCQGLLRAAEGPRRIVSPRGTYAMEIDDVTVEGHRLTATIHVVGPGGRTHHLQHLPGQAFFLAENGRIVTVESSEATGRPAIVRVVDLDGTELLARAADGLTDPALSADGARFAYRTRDGVVVFDLATFAEIRYPRLHRFAAGSDDRLAGIMPGTLLLFDGAGAPRSVPRLQGARRIAFADDGAVLVLDARRLQRYDWATGAAEIVFTAPAGTELRDLRTDDGTTEIGLKRLRGDETRGELVILDRGGRVLRREQGPSRRFPRLAGADPRQVVADPRQAGTDPRQAGADPRHSPIPWPLAPDAQHEVGNTYGEFQFYGGSPYLHPGVNVMGEAGQPVYAVRDGVVKAILTTSGSLHWRVAIGDSVTAGTVGGFLYAHLDEPTIAVNFGDVVQQGDYLGDLVQWTVAEFHHVHFARIEDSGHQWFGDWLCTENPHVDFPGQSETDAPIFEPARGNDLLAFCDNETSDYQEPDALQGEVDIIAHVGDRIISTWVCTVQEIRYSIYPVGNPQAPTVDDKLAVRFDMPLDLYQGGPIGPMLVDLFFKQDSVCPTMGNYDTREFYHIITNSNGDEIYEEADRWEAWDTSLVPDGDYVVRVTALDVAGNATVDSMVVTTANGTTSAAALGAPSPGAIQRVHPNPTLGTSSIDFALVAPRRVTLAVYDAGGRRVRTLIDDALLPAGRQAYVWDGTDLRRRPVASGVYFLALDGVAGRQVDKVVVAR